MKKFVGHEGLFYAIFSENDIKIKNIKNNLPYYNTNETKPSITELEITINGSIEQVELYKCTMPTTALNMNPTKKLTELEYDFYINPPEDSIIIYDRWIFERYIDFIFRKYGISQLEKLINRYKKRNVKVILNFAFFEPTDYESLYYFLITYNYGFDNIKLTDYELFNGKSGFVFAKTFNIFHLVGDLMYFTLEQYFKKNSVPSIQNLFVVENIENPEKIYTHLTLKPRPHRIYLINKLYDLNIIDYGYCTINKSMYSEYEYARNQGIVYSTDNSLMQNKWLHNYFKDMDYRGYEYYSKSMEDTLGNDFWCHLRQYIERNEYKKSYIDVVGETHILFDTMYSYFSEKSYYPVLMEKFFIIYGGNRFYQMLEELDCYNCLDLFGLDSNYYKIESPYEQVDIVSQKLKELIDKINSKEFDIEKFYKENKHKLIDTKQKIFSKYMEEIKSIKKYIY
jgi:hypothetical protein